MSLQEQSAAIKAAARHEDARKLLNDHGVGVADLPNDFDGAALLADLDNLGIRYLVADVVEAPFATKADASAVDRVRKAAIALKAALSALLDDETREAGKWRLAEHLPEPLEPWRAPLEWVEGVSRLTMLRDEAAALSIGADAAERRLHELRAEGPAFPREDGPTARSRLMVDELPALFKRAFGQDCGIGISDPDGAATIGLRFVVACMAYLGDPVSPAAALQVIKRARRNPRWGHHGLR